MKKLLPLGVVIALAFALIVPLTSSSVMGEQGGQLNVRSLNLYATAGPPYDEARGRCVIQGAMCTFSASGLPIQYGGTTYGLYVSTPSIGQSRRISFNTIMGQNNAAYATQVWLGTQPEWTTEPIKVDVYQELDDGHKAPDVGGPLVLSSGWVDP